MNEQKKYCTFAPPLMKQFLLLCVKVSVGRFNRTQNNTPPMPLLDAHLGGFFFSAHE